MAESRKPVTSYQDLEVWSLGMDLAVNAYRMTRAFPKEELFGLTSQLRRSAASIPANVAEGFGRESTGDFIRFLQIAQGSLKEFETHLLLASRVSLIDESTLGPAIELCGRLGKMLRSMIRKIQEQQAVTPRSSKSANQSNTIARTDH